MQTIEVKSCGECPFIKHPDLDYCTLDKNVRRIWMPRLSVHENCPLKKESVTVKLKEDESIT